VKIVVVGGTGLIGAKLVAWLKDQGHEAIPASPRLGINTLTGEGLAIALTGASVVVDVSNSPATDYASALDFFERSTTNLVAAARAAQVGHAIALSGVGTPALARLGDLKTTNAGYFQAKATQEALVAASRIPFTVVRATQFFEFTPAIADGATAGTTVRVPPASIQSMAADDVAKAIGRVALEGPVNGLIEIGGPERFTLEALIRRYVAARRDPRDVVIDPQATYFGISLEELTLCPADGARLGEIRFDDWLRTLQPTVVSR
jgi:uncharacterized protein YbjT (DUF2867 family)